jgi:epoxyqueuosine reductase
MMAPESLTTRELTRRIIDAAHRLGFQKVGILPAQALREEEQRLSEWLNNGYHADMGWMAEHTDKRLHPALLMEGTKSIVCVAMNYYNPDPPEYQNDPEVLKIAKYARGTDYHDVIKVRLKGLLTEIQQWVPEAQGRALTDSAPILEKALAVRAGIGWQGKNANILTRDYGSWLFLGELLLDIDLDYSLSGPPEVDHCGRCNRCIQACPTDAIREAKVVDANRCIAYWTIEHKGDEIPEAIAEKISGWMFGCDICQDVCPWNIRFAQPTQEELFQSRDWNKTPRAKDFDGLDVETFRERYRKSPMKRPKLPGILRNVRAASRAQQRPEP